MPGDPLLPHVLGPWVTVTPGLLSQLCIRTSSGSHEEAHPWLRQSLQDATLGVTILAWYPSTFAWPACRTRSPGWVHLSYTLSVHRRSSEGTKERSACWFLLSLETRARLASGKSRPPGSSSSRSANIGLSCLSLSKLGGATTRETLPELNRCDLGT